MHRRDWIRLAVAVSVAGQLPRWAWAASLRGGNPFGLGVASGSPGADRIVLWTRLVREDLGPLPLDRAVTVRWEVAEDDAFRRITQRGEASALPQLGHSVHVEVTGLLPDRRYWYRFMVEAGSSPVGRTRTLPAAGDTPARLRFGLASCQRWEHGYYAAWRHLREQNPDLVVFVGDYIYEYPSAKQAVRSHTQPMCESLPQYRARYALYKSDPHLQAMHAACPWLLTWDDHEVSNDYAGLQDENLADDFAQRRAAAYQAYYENMPLSAQVLVSGAQLPAELRLYQRVSYGQLARFHVLDGRQYRDPQACQKDGRGGSRMLRADLCEPLTDARRSLLGRVQEAWLDEGLALDRQDATQWSVIAQQTAFTPRNFSPSGEPATLSSDAWDGYPAARARLIASLQRHAPRNPVIVGGDIHMHWVADVHARPQQVDTPIVAAEFTGTSISSRNSSSVARVAQVLERNAHARFAAADRRGYVLCDVTPQAWETRLFGVDDVTRPDSPLTQQAAFAVEAGVRGVRRL